MKTYLQAEVNRIHHGAVLMMGNFDGVHLGHMALYETARDYARKHKSPLGVFTFDPHPRQFFSSAHKKPEPFLLTPGSLKADIFQSYGFDFMVSIPFDKAYAEMTAHAFVERILVNQIKVAAVAVGEDFGYGKGREGTTSSLKYCKKFETLIVSKHSSEDSNTVFSSTQIRSNLKNGNIVMANHLMNRPFTISGTVFRGERVGTELGFPTANLRPMADQIFPKFGVYAGRAMLQDGSVHDAAINWGIRPTMRQKSAIYEAHLLNFSGDLYDQPIRIALLEYLRPEQKFLGTSDLAKQISQDCERARQALERHAKDTHYGRPISPKQIDEKTISSEQRMYIEAAVFRRLLQHLQNRTDVQNIDLMLLANFCRNCFSQWYVDAANDIGCSLDKEAAQEIVYGMSYADWKEKYQIKQPPEKLALLRKSK